MLFQIGLRNGQFNLILKKNVFSRKDREHPPVYFGLNGDEINEIDNHCHLGITFQSSATWKKLIDDIYKKKACSRLFLLRQVKHLLDRYLLYVYILHLLGPFMNLVM
jgi:hypothetical protein